MRELVLATYNRSKVIQAKPILSGLGITVFSLTELGVHEKISEDGDTLEKNALLKAEFAVEKTGKWSVADDTGLYIDALEGFPGIRAARWAGKNRSTEDIMQFTLNMLRGVPAEKRTGTFVTVAVVVSPYGRHNYFSETARGTFLTEPRVPCQPDMPYSSIFVPAGQVKTWAEMSVDEENAISHRGKTFRLVRECLAKEVL